jgi:hypothetical protein
MTMFGMRKVASQRMMFVDDVEIEVVRRKDSWDCQLLRTRVVGAKRGGESFVVAKMKREASDETLFVGSESIAKQARSIVWGI